MISVKNLASENEKHSPMRYIRPFKKLTVGFKKGTVPSIFDKRLQTIEDLMVHQ
jgi:hypothetical protein